VLRDSREVHDVAVDLHWDGYRVEELIRPHQAQPNAFSTPPPRPSSASGEHSPRFETRPGLMTGPGLLYPHTRAQAFRAPLGTSLPRFPHEGSLHGRPHENPVCSSLDLARWLSQAANVFGVQ
jgi:hypothetical protein